MSNETTCGACRYFARNLPPCSSRFGGCKRFPPSDHGAGGGSISCFPTVEETDWCGEFAPALPTLTEFIRGQSSEQPKTGVAFTDAAAAGAIPALDKLRDEAAVFGQPDPIAERLSVDAAIRRGMERGASSVHLMAAVAARAADLMEDCAHDSPRSVADELRATAAQLRSKFAEANAKFPPANP